MRHHGAPRFVGRHHKHTHQRTRTIGIGQHVASAASSRTPADPPVAAKRLRSVVPVCAWLVSPDPAVVGSSCRVSLSVAVAPGTSIPTQQPRAKFLRRLLGEHCGENATRGKSVHENELERPHVSVRVLPVLGPATMNSEADFAASIALL